MIHHLSGLLQYREGDFIIMDVHGVGYGVTVPLNTADTLPAAGQSVALHIHTEVKEDSIALFGFADVEEKRTFLLLQSVSGIGPKLALSILSRAKVQDFLSLLAAEDDQALSKLPGIGPKRAQTMVLELKEKAKKMLRNSNLQVPPPTTADHEVAQALEALGYSRHEAQTACAKLPDALAGKAIEERLRAALVLLSSRS